MNVRILLLQSSLFFHVALILLRRWSWCSISSKGLLIIYISLAFFGFKFFSWLLIAKYRCFIFFCRFIINLLLLLLIKLLSKRVFIISLSNVIHSLWEVLFFLILLVPCWITALMFILLLILKHNIPRAEILLKRWDTW